ncbi:15910_t:CDS:2, partial [Cetraspora pellucida]
ETIKEIGCINLSKTTYTRKFIRYSTSFYQNSESENLIIKN